MNVKLQPLLRRAKKGDPNAQFLVAMLYLNGEEIRKDISKALFWLEKSSENGDADAIMRLGELYWCGSGKICVNEIRAIELFKRAANKGVVKAQYLLGVIFATDEKFYNPTEAVIWYRMAAKSGDLEALYNLGVMYQLGEGVKRNLNVGSKLVALGKQGSE